MSTSLVVVADAHIWGLREVFSQLPGFDVELRVLESSQINRESLHDADILLVRSSVRVGSELLEGTPVRFVATATIGDDHVDKDWLAGQGIAFASAAGSSTGSVVEYMLSVLLELHHQQVLRLPHLTLGIIGAGRIGGRLAHIANELGMEVLINDPPRARQEGVAGFVSLDEMLERADVITLHTPLSKEGEDATWHLLGDEQLLKFQGKGIINAARGACLDNGSLLGWLDESPDHWAVLDCWEDEPVISRTLLEHYQLLVATPHIAGHSLDGKAANTRYVYEALCKFLHIQADWQSCGALPKPVHRMEIQASGDLWKDLHRASSMLYPLMQDDSALRRGADLEDHGMRIYFTHLRRFYPVRRAWPVQPLRFVPSSPELEACASVMGMNCREQE